jgi:Domain of unknown function (DUF4926)
MYAAARPAWLLASSGINRDGGTKVVEALAERRFAAPVQGSSEVRLLRGRIDTPRPREIAGLRECSPFDELFREVEATAMHTTPHLLDVVALLSDVPAHGLLRGQVGTIVEILDGAYEVEFSDDEGRTYAELALPSDQLLILHHRPQQAA